jgi:hypothetical protein
MPFEPRLFSGADGNLDGSANGSLGGGFDRSHYVDPAAAESGRPPAMNTSAARSRDTSLLRPVAADVDCDSDLELPDQLAMLAAQLRDEADQLAAQHAPPDVHAIEPITDRNPRRKLWRYAAVALVGLGLVAWRSLASQDRTLPNVGTMAQDTSTAKANLVARTSEPSTARPQGEAKGSMTLAAAASNQPTPPAGPDPQAMRANQGIEEVVAGESPAARHPPADELEMLHRQVDGFDKLIHRLQAELAARDAAQMENEKLIQSLRQENEQLRRQQAGANP